MSDKEKITRIEGMPLEYLSTSTLQAIARGIEEELEHSHQQLKQDLES